MQQMCRVLGERSQTDQEYLPEFAAAHSVNEQLQTITDPDKDDFNRIVRLLADIDRVPHANGSLWFDYKIHVMAMLRVNGFNQQ